MFSKASIGVEISNGDLTITHARSTLFDTKVTAHSVYELDAAAPFAEKLDTVSTRVKDFLRRQRIGSACLWIGLPAQMVIQRVIEMPSAAKENLAKAIEYELPKYLPLAPEDIYFRYQILGEDKAEKQLTILVAAVKKKDLAPLIELRKDLGGGIYGVESAATAGINGLKWASHSVHENARVLAYIADGTLHLSCFENGRLRFIRSLNLADDLAYQFERIRREFKSSGTDRPEPDDTALLSVYCHGPGATPDTLAELNELPNLEFNLLNIGQSPLENDYPVAGVGLALKGLQSVPVDINLLPEQFRKRPSVIGRYATLALVLLTLISGLAWAGGYFAHQRLIAARVDAELNELSHEIKALAKAQTKISALRQQIDYLASLRADRINALAFLKELTEIVPDTAWLSGLSVAGNQVEIQGYADYSTRLISGLEGSPLFSNAKFSSTITQSRDGKQVFKISFAIKRP